MKETCQCESCTDGNIHTSDCAVHNEPAFPKGECNCIISKREDGYYFVRTLKDFGGEWHIARWVKKLQRWYMSGMIHTYPFSEINENRIKMIDAMLTDTQITLHFSNGGVLTTTPLQIWELFVKDSELAMKEGRGVQYKLKKKL